MNLQNAVAIASVAEIFETEVALAFRELVSESFLELRARSTHESALQKPSDDFFFVVFLEKNVYIYIYLSQNSQIFQLGCVSTQRFTLHRRLVEMSFVFVFF